LQLSFARGLEAREILAGMGLHLGMDVDALLGGKAPKSSAPDDMPMDADMEIEDDDDSDSDSDSDNDSEIAIENS